MTRHQINPWRIFALASLCNCDELRLAMVDKIKERASSGNLAYSWVIAIGESLGIPELLGEGYYRTVIKVRQTRLDYALLSLSPAFSRPSLTRYVGVRAGSDAVEQGWET